MTKKRVVKAPDSIEVVRLRKETFIGETSTPIHLVHEAVDNFIDEIRNGFASTAELEFGKDGSIWVKDNGRGLPVGETYVEELGKKQDTTELLFTKLHTGTKFDLDDYDSLFGQNGIGLVAINALSDWVDIKIKKDNKSVYHYKFEKSSLKSKTIENEKTTWNTVVGFKPSKDYFDEIKYDKTIFEQRLKLATAKIKKSKFILNGKEIQKQSFEEFARNILEIDKKTPLFKITYDGVMPVKIDGKEIEKPANIFCFLTYEPGKTITTGDANLRICDGTFLTSFQTLLKSLIPSKLSKKFSNVPERYLTDGLRLYISLHIPEPKFDSQTKVRMTTPIKKYLIDPLEPKLNKILSEKYIQETIEQILERKLTGSIKTTNTSNNLRNISATNKVQDCLNTPGDTLYLLEGDSADSTLQEIRNKYTEGSLPLRGKVINVEKQSFDKIMNNKEIKDLIEAIGPKENRRYKNIKILADADCFPPTTPLFFRDKNDCLTWKRFSEISDDEIKSVLSFNPETNKVEEKSVIKFIKKPNTNNREFMRIRVWGNNPIECTVDHKFWVYNKTNKETELIAAKHLNKMHHQILTPKEILYNKEKLVTINIDDEQIELNKDLSFIIGGFIGAGTIDNDKIIIDCTRSKEKFTEFIKAAETLSFWSEIIEETEDQKIISIESPKLLKILKTLGLIPVLSDENKFIPKILFDAQLNSKMGFLRGLYSVNGWIYFHVNQPTMVYRTWSDEFRIGLMFLLRQFGILPNRPPIVSPKKSGIQFDPSKDGKIFNVMIQRYPDVLRLKRVFSLIHNIKLDQVRKKYLKIKYSRVDRNLIALPIQNLEKIEPFDELYCLEVEDNHNFSVGEYGYFTKNCDGAHIVVLIILILHKYFDDMIKNGNVSVVYPPLYGGRKGTKYVPIYSINDVEKYRAQGYNIRRFKGLGEMNSLDLKACLDTKTEYVVSYPKNKKDLDKLIKIITDTELKRKIMNDKDNDFQTFMNLILKNK